MKIRLANVRDHGLGDVIDTAARNAGVTDDQMAFYMSHFIETLADHVARGGVVTIPGFGKFASCLIYQPRSGRKMRPRFAPHAGWRHQVALCAPVSTRGNDALAKWGHKHNSVNFKVTSRPFKAMQEIRATIKAQMAGD